MMTKKEKILHEIAVNMRDNENRGPAAMLAGANMAQTIGGTFSAKDVSEILRYCAQVALGVDGIKAARELSSYYEDSVREIRRKCREEVERAEDRADSEYERAREDFGRRAEEAEDRIDQYRDKAEGYESLRDAIGEDIFFALCEMTPVSHCLPCDTAKVVEAIENCGKFNGFGQLALAV